MVDDSINLLEELDSLSKIHTLKREDIDNLMIEFAKRILTTFRLERMSVWIFNQEKDAIISMGEYHLPTRSFSKETTLLKSKHPNYIKAINENEILLIENVYTNKNTKELTKDYLKPNKVISLMDIPMRQGGELIGVMCFEKTGSVERVFTKNEQVFALSIAIVFASNLEARHRRTLQHKLNQELKEKELLIKEIHHRVKNNLMVISSLINLQSGKAKDSFHKNLFEECRNKINSIAEVHKMVYNSKSFTTINSKEYFPELLNNLNAFYFGKGRKIKLDYKIEEVPLELDNALPMALIVNEVVSNAYKHAFKNIKSGEILFSLKSRASKITLIIKDNGNGFTKNSKKDDSSLGIEIINGLVGQLDGKHTYKSTKNNGVVFSLTFLQKNK